MRAVVVASAYSGPSDYGCFVLDEYATVPHIVIAVNETFRWLKRFDHWVTLHPEKLDGWRNEAALMGRDLSAVEYWVPELDGDDRFQLLRGKPWPAYATKHWWEWTPNNSGSSGLFGVGVAFTLGCDRVVLAGVPMDQGGHWNSPRTWADRNKFVGAWSASKPRLEGRVRSFSGWTRDFLGEPTLQWWGH